MVYRGPTGSCSEGLLVLNLRFGRSSQVYRLAHTKPTPKRQSGPAVGAESTGETASQQLTAPSLESRASRTRSPLSPDLDPTPLQQPLSGASESAALSQTSWKRCTWTLCDAVRIEIPFRAN